MKNANRTVSYQALCSSASNNFAHILAWLTVNGGREEGKPLLMYLSSTLTGSLMLCMCVIKEIFSASGESCPGSAVSLFHWHIFTLHDLFFPPTIRCWPKCRNDKQQQSNLIFSTKGQYRKLLTADYAQTSPRNDAFGLQWNLSFSRSRTNCIFTTELFQNIPKNMETFTICCSIFLLLCSAVIYDIAAIRWVKDRRICFHARLLFVHITCTLVTMCCSVT